VGVRRAASSYSSEGPCSARSQGRAWNRQRSDTDETRVCGGRYTIGGGVKQLMIQGLVGGSSGSAGPWHLCGLEDEAQALAGHMALVHAARCSCDVLRDACTHAS